MGCPVCFQPLSVDFKPPDTPMARPPDDELTEAEMQGIKAPKFLKGNILNRIDLENFSTSSKVEALAKMLKELDSGDKAIVFSQYTNMIDLIEWRLKKAKIKVVKLLGSMPLNMRRAMLDAFRHDSTVPVILMSLKAGGEGLNLQVASHVFVLEPWWNPAVEATSPSPTLNPNPIILTLTMIQGTSYSESTQDRPDQASEGCSLHHQEHD